MTATAARGTYWSHADAPSAIVRCANGDEESELVAAGFTRITALETGRRIIGGSRCESFRTWMAYAQALGIGSAVAS